MTEATSEREPGFYWIVTFEGAAPEVGFWTYNNGGWRLTGTSWRWEDSEFAAIGPRIEPPPSPAPRREV